MPLALWLAGCASTSGSARWRSSPGAGRPAAWARESTSFELDSAWVLREPRRGQSQADFYEEFAREEERALRRRQLPERERQLGLSALTHLRAWAFAQDEATLARTAPWKELLRLRVQLERQAREDSTRLDAVADKLVEYERWGLGLMLEVVNPFHAVGRDYLVTDSPLAE